MFASTYNGENSYIKDVLSEHWTTLGRSSATRDIQAENIWFHIEIPFPQEYFC